MNSRNIIVAAALLSLAVARPSLATDLEYDAANGSRIRIHHAQPNLLIRQGVTPTNILAGETDVDSPRAMTCKSSAGCLIIAKVWVSFFNMQIPTVSAYVDDVAMAPQNVMTASTVLTAQQSMLVSAGPHVVQTKVTQATAQGQITGWNIEYAKYELPVR